MLVFHQVLVVLISIILKSDLHASQSVPGIFLGYYQENIISLPKMDILSTGLTLSKCALVCGQRKNYLVAVKDSMCWCGANLTKTVKWVTSCPNPLPCPGDPSEECGCYDLIAYYNTEFYGQCKLKLFLGSHKMAGSTSELTVQLHGDKGECNEVSMPGSKVPTLSKGVSSNCVDIGNVKSIRLGNAGPMDGFQIDRVTVELPSDAINYPRIPRVTYEFKFNNWLGADPTRSTGPTYRVVDLFANGTGSQVPFSYPETDGGSFYKNYSAAPASYYDYCTIERDCPMNYTYVAFQRVFYKRIIVLPDLLIIERTGCYDPSEPKSTNVSYNFIPTSDKTSTRPGTVVTYSCTVASSYFEVSKTNRLSVKCNTAGSWILTAPWDQICVSDCTVSGPAVPDGAKSNFTDSARTYNTVLAYVCSSGVFGGTLLRTIHARCQENGQWSISKLPPCIPVPPNLPGPIRTSDLRPMSSFYKQN